MKINIGKLFKRKEDYDSENIMCPIKNFDRDKYLNRRMIFRIFFILLYGFGFGYIIGYKNLDIKEIKIMLRDFFIFYILGFYLIQIPHEFIHTLFYKSVFKNEKNYLIFFNKKRIVTSKLQENIKPFMLFLSLITPFILFSVIPLITIYYIGFDLFLYTLSLSNAVLSSDDLLNIFLQTFSKDIDGYKTLYEIPNNYNYLVTPKEANCISKNINNN